MKYSQITAPTAITSNATAITQTSATLNGTVNPNRAATTAWFEIGTTTSYGTTLPTNVVPNDGFVDQPRAEGVSGLSPLTEYHYRFTAQNVHGTTYGADATFTTLPLPPSLTLDTVDQITNGSGRLRFVLHPNGAATNYHAEYGTTSGYGQQTATASQPAQGTPANVTVDLTGLTAATLHHYRVVATNNGGTTTSVDGVFTTRAQPAAGTFTVLHSMAAADGSQPNAGVREGPGGFLFGGNSVGGANGAGTAFKVSTAGSFTRLHDFTGSGTGSDPETPLVPGTDGNVYGSCYAGGANGFGTFFQLTPGGTVTALWHHTAAEGATPTGTTGSDGAGRHYGTTRAGGASGQGVVYRSGQSASSFVVLASLNGTSTGAEANGAVFNPNDGLVYFAANGGGSNGRGIVGRVADAVGSSIAVLYSFSDADGKNPASAPVLGSDGNLYGTAHAGGPSDAGAVYRLTTGGSYTALKFFGGSAGSFPYGTPAEASDGFIYGTCVLGGANNKGTLWRVTKTGQSFEVLHDFNGTDGEQPQFGGVIQASDGNIYGTTRFGGANNLGTVWRHTLINLTPLQEWKQAQLGDANAPDEGDDDNDGRVHFAEFALLSDPDAPTPGGPGATTFVTGGETYLRMDFDFRGPPSDVTIEVQAAPGPGGPWTTVATSIAGAAMTGPGVIPGGAAYHAQVRDTVPMSAATRRFMHVRMTVP